MVIVNIAERKALEEQLNQDQKMNSIGIMASGIAHDLNNILCGIINYPELLLHQVPYSMSLKKVIINRKLGARITIGDEMISTRLVKQ